MNSQPPSKLYKYQPYAVWSLDNLKTAQIRFSKPMRFNDPFDCAIAPIISEPSESEWATVFNDARESIANKEEFDRKYSLNGIANETFRSETRSITSKLLESRTDITLNHRGVACFSETVDDLLMWSHYTNGHRGFCLEFDTTSPPFQKAFSVRYSESFPALNPADLLREGPSEPLMALVWTKSSHWSYEREWRIFHMIGDQQYSIEPHVITAVYFGCSMPSVHREVISSLLGSPSTRRYVMEKVPGKFSLYARKVEQ